MRNYSKVSPKLWTGTVGKALRSDPEAQALAVYLVTCPHSNMVGLYHLPVAYVAADLGWQLEGASKALARVCEVGFARYDDEHERVWIVEHARHEFGDELKAGDNRIQGIAKQLEDQRVSGLFGEFLDRYGEPLNLDTEGLARGSEAPPKPLRSQEQEQEPEQEAGVEIPDALASLSVTLLDAARQACASTRTTGRMADSVWQGTLAKLAQYPVHAVRDGLTVYVDKGYCADGKDEKYLVGIVRGKAKEPPPTAGAQKGPDDSVNLDPNKYTTWEPANV